MTEFPSLSQLTRILREEGIPSSAGEQAFGKSRVKSNGGGDVVEVGYLKIGNTEATEYAGPEAKLAGKIHISGPNVDVFKTYPEFQKIAEKLGIDTSDVLSAFGHMIRKSKLGAEIAPKAAVYGSKYIKIGHVGTRGLARGTKKGSLVLLDSRDPSKAIWGVIEEIPGTIRNIATNRVVSLAGVFEKAKSLKIPAQAVYDAFGHLMSAKDKKELLAGFHQSGRGMNVAKNKRRTRR